MPTPTYTPLAEITLGSSATTISFSSISQLYRDLVLITSAKMTSGQPQNPRARLNGDTGNNYYLVYMDGYGSGSGASGIDVANSNFSLAYAGSGTSNPVISILNIMDYSATDRHKSMLIRSGQAENAVSAYAVRWADTSAVTSITISSGSINFESGTTFALYGIAA